MSIFHSSKNNEKNYLLDPIEKRKRYDNVFDTDRSTSEDSIESASSVDEYLTVSMKLSRMCDIGYFQIIEPKKRHEEGRIKHGKMKRMSLLEKWQTSKARKCFRYSAFTLTWLMSFLQTLNFHCFRWLKEKNSTWKALTINQVRVNEL